MNKIIILCLSILFYSSTAHSKILFTETFDTQTDWVPTCLICGNDYNGYSGAGAAVGTPTNWNFWSNYEWWNQYASTPTANTQPTVRIDSSEHRGDSGKALICTQESNIGTGDNYGADGVLMKYLPEGHDEIVVRFYIKYKTDFVRNWVTGANAAMIKTFRAMHWDGNGSVHTYFTSGYSAPIALVQVGQNEYYGGNANLSVRCDPQETAYSADSTITRGVFRDINGDSVSGWATTSPDNSMIGAFSDVWHQFVFRIKKNSSIGVADGEYQFYQNGVLVATRTNIEWIKEGGDINANWNLIAFGGNAFNNYLGINDHTYVPGAEQYYAIDDIVVATTYEEAVTGGSPIIFQDNFDSSTTWSNPCERSDVACGCDEDVCKNNEIDNWDYWNVDEYWNPSVDNDTSHAQINISQTNAYKGKCITFYNEAHNGRNGDGWGSDGVVLKKLPSSYHELYIGMRMRYQKGYSWLKDGAAVKTLRVMYNDGYRPVNFSGGIDKDNDPLYFYDLSYKTSGTNRFNFHTFRCSPASTDYFCDETQASTENTVDVTDGYYHTYIFHYKENTTPGVHDGIFEMYIDGVLQYSRTDIAYVRTGGLCRGFNMFGIGGNNNNSTDGDTPPNLIANIRPGQLEQWYAIDDVKVGTTFNSVNNLNNTVLFQEDFNSISDWQPSNLVGGCSKVNCPEQPPTNWDYFRNDEYWIPSLTPGSKPSIRITSEQPYNTGKSFICTNESESNSPNGGGSGWASDGVLSKVLPSDHKEIWAEIKIKFQTPFKRIWNEANGSSIKVFRILHWDRVGSIYDYFSDGHSNPSMIMNIGQNNYHVASTLSVRCDPQETNYYCDETYISRGNWVNSEGNIVTGYGTSVDSSNLGIYDGNWHTLRFRVVLNSAPGVKDGIYQFWQDGYQTAGISDIAWIGTNGDMSAGWNTIEIGGNVYNNYLGITNHIFQAGAEQWYAIDNVYVATSLEGLNSIVTTPTTPVIGFNIMNTEIQHTQIQ